MKSYLFNPSSLESNVFSIYYTDRREVRLAIQLPACSSRRVFPQVV
jgi:hypothetical protein